MINNKNAILPLLDFPHKDIFYFVQILQRKKDHPGERLGGSNNNSRVIKTYYITSIEKLELLWEEMIKLAQLFNARVSINLNPRNFKKAGFHCLQKIANQMANDDFYNIRKAYDSVCGEYHAEIDKRWLVDIDDKNEDYLALVVNKITELHNQINNKQYSVLVVLPSKAGFHIITHPFNIADFQSDSMFADLEIHKNNPTNLYIP